MVCSALLIGLLLGLSYTDVRWHLLPNRVTYPATAVGLLANLLTTLWGTEASPVEAEAWSNRWGFVGIGPSGMGFLACGGLLLICYIFMPGEVGGGDVKLLAMVGAYLGVYPGLEVVLWTFVIAACFSLLRLVWQLGAWSLITRTIRHLVGRLRWGAQWEMPLEDRQALRSPLYLTPSTLLAVVVVRFGLFG